MWRSEFLINALYRSSSSYLEETLLNTPECKHVLDMLLAYLKKFVEIAVPDVRCNNELDDLYNSLVLKPETRDCLNKLPLEWQAVLITHLQNSCAFKTKKEVKGSPDVEYILPSTIQLVKNLTSQPYWREMMDLSIEYAYGKRFLPVIDKDLRKSPTIKGSEAVLYKFGSKADPSVETRERLCLMQNLKPVSAGSVPTITLTESVRVFSDQQLSDKLATFPQPELHKLIENKSIYDLEWQCGFIWTHTYPFWNWENGLVRLDITIPESTTVMYTSFSEIYMFTSIFDTSRHMTLLLRPGKLNVTEIIKVPRPLQHGLEDMGNALYTEQFITIIRCTYAEETLEPASKKSKI